jgi:hypothetical protein
MHSLPLLVRAASAGPERVDKTQADRRHSLVCYILGATFETGRPLCATPAAVAMMAATRAAPLRAHSTMAQMPNPVTPP